MFASMKMQQPDLAADNPVQVVDWNNGKAGKAAPASRTMRS